MGRRGCLGLGFFSLLLGSYFCHCFFGLLLSFSFFSLLLLVSTSPPSLLHLVATH
jgi:hypothetical protein